MNIHKIGIGSVQFGLKYGISNDSGRTEKEEVAKIVNYCQENGISYLDTAFGYGNAEEILGNFDLHSFRIVSKCLNEKTQIPIVKQFSISSIKLNSTHFYAYMAHRPQNLLENPSDWFLMNELKMRGLVQKIGFSLNSPQELEDLLALDYIPDIVQVPYNYFDRRFEKYFSYLNEINCEIHTRSTFLQGLFFVPIEKLNEHFDEVKPVLKELQTLYPENLHNALLNFVLKNHLVDATIIGVENLKQLKNNIKGLSLSLELPELKQKKIKDSILMPSFWQK